MISFLNDLCNCASDDDSNALLDSAESPAYEQIINSSQWPINTKINMVSIETLKAMIIWEEFVLRREKQINALKEGLDLIGLYTDIRSYPDFMMEYFVPVKKELSPLCMVNLI